MSFHLYTLQYLGLLLVLVFTLKNAGVECGQLKCEVEDDWRFDCLPRGALTKRDCIAKGCCWKVPAKPLPPSASGLSVPTCYFPNDYATYNVTSINPSDERIRVSATLQRRSHYPKDVKHVVVDFIRVDDNILRIQIRDGERDRWEVPPLPTGQRPNARRRSSAVSSDYKYRVQVPEPGHAFGFEVMRRNGSSSLLKTAGAFIFSDQLLQLSTLIPSPILYGLGEHRSKLMTNISWTVVTLWNDGHFPQENTDLYGSHPFYLCRDGSDWHGVFLHTSNAMDVILQPAPAVTWRPIGGIIDLYVLIGGTSPSHVVSQYLSIVGRPTLPPYWALGFHLCWQRYGSANETLSTAERMKRLGIPQDVQWNDIDYAYKSRTFTLDPQGFGDQTALCRHLHDWGMHYVIMADCGIYNLARRGTYEAYDLGVDLDIFIKDDTGRKDLIGKVWPGTTVWPDFLSPKSQEYWTRVIQHFHRSVQFDGLWVDMNEITSFTDGSVDGCRHNSSLDFPPYLPAVRRGALYRHTVCPSSRHSTSSHYNVHNLYGLYEAIKTNTALKAVRRRRPFVISRSTYPGHGQYGGHWSGDNKSSWYDMYKSIAAMLHMNMYGVPLTGSDICGFFLNTTEELCIRWHQLGAFYVFARNHHSFDSIPQDPGAFSPTAVRAIRKALVLRYTLLPQLYTLLWKSSTDGTPVARPLFWTFPEDDETLNLDGQFMWGSHLLISPVLREGERHVIAYLPKATWYNFFTGGSVQSPGRFYNLLAPLDVINVHVRAGHMVHMQEPAQTTTLSRRRPFWLLVVLDEDGMSAGQIYWDDGDSIVDSNHTRYNLVQYTAYNNSLQSAILHDGYRTEPMVLGNITVFGIKRPPQSVTLDGHPIVYTFHDEVLYATTLALDLTLKAFWLKWN